MQIGMIGLGRMGGTMVQRLLGGGHRCAVFDSHADRVAALAGAGATGAGSLAALVASLEAPRVVWMMVPAAAVEPVVEALSPHLQTGDTLVDGGNSHYVHDIRRAAALAVRGIHY